MLEIVPYLPAKYRARLLIGGRRKRKSSGPPESDGMCSETLGKQSLAVDVVPLEACPCEHS